MNKVVSFFVPGTPVPQGSKTIRRHGDKAWLTDVNDKSLKAWRATVNKVAAQAMALERLEPIDSAVEVHATFYLPKPASVKREFPHVKPDLDKLQRALFDSLQPCFVDDSRVTDVHAQKRYAEVSGVSVRIMEKTNDDAI